MNNLFIDTLYHSDDYSGRCSRKEFWLWRLYTLLWVGMFSFVTGILGIVLKSPGMSGGVAWLVLLIVIADVAATTRRMHDVGKSGWWQLVPFYGFILTLSRSEN